jgi:5'-nucleotidase
MLPPLILVTNDDGIASPGLAAAVAALEPLGELLIVAPTTQQTSKGRSRSQQGGLDGQLSRYVGHSGDWEWEGFGVNATPALTVELAVQELASRPIDLAVSGINYGENVGTCVTVSGTIGAALEAAERGIPALAVSLEVDPSLHFAHDLKAIDFAASMHFTRLFAEKVLSSKLPFDVDMLKVEVPAAATPGTAWVVTRQDRLSYYLPLVQRGSGAGSPARFDYRIRKGEFTSEDTDAFAMARGRVSVTPLSLDLTSRVAIDAVARLLGQGDD